MADQIDEQDVANLEPKAALRFRDHAINLKRPRAHRDLFSAIEDSTARGSFGTWSG